MNRNGFHSFPHKPAMDQGSSPSPSSAVSTCSNERDEEKKPHESSTQFPAELQFYVDNVDELSAKPRPICAVELRNTGRLELLVSTIDDMMTNNIKKLKFELRFHGPLDVFRAKKQTVTVNLQVWTTNAQPLVQSTRTMYNSQTVTITPCIDAYRDFATGFPDDTLVCDLRIQAINDADPSRPITPLPAVPQLLNDQNTSDVVFRVGGRRIFAHKAMLKGGSVYFERMFQGRFAETSAGDVTVDAHCEIDIQDFDYDTFTAFLLYLYTGRTSFPGLKVKPQELHRVSDKYLVDGLKLAAEKLIVADLTPENVGTYLFLYAANHKRLCELVVQFVAFNWSRVSMTSEWREERMRYMEDLAKDNLMSMLMDALARYASRDLENNTDGKDQAPDRSHSGLLPFHPSRQNQRMSAWRNLYA
ncbi:hypothetical protein BC938DRAFT_476990 [Jimgerdemannia flammicorona]|uniref:BTB domain-containing protein n=1 Tax=Jimgerdemannia flammicorona TaxID=994334 RepID=A0A433QYZ8_9FUNG|nr:hypothetical protein BC938DRAFT_476990 [Jimgerdemannia flammicorona]